MGEDLAYEATQVSLSKLDKEVELKLAEFGGYGVQILVGSNDCSNHCFSRNSSAHAWSRR
jgi:hypothetical protein